MDQNCFSFTVDQPFEANAVEKPRLSQRSTEDHHWMKRKQTSIQSQGNNRVGLISVDIGLKSM